MPGFGESERIDIGENPEVTWPEILEEVITSLIPKEFFLAGHSLGGWLATLLSLRNGMRSRIKGDLKNQYLFYYLNYYHFIHKQLGFEVSH